MGNEAITIEAANRLLAAEKLATPPGKIVILGFGSVGQTVLPLVLRHFNIEPENVIVMDRIQHPLFQKYKNSGVQYKVASIDKSNLDDVLSSVLEQGDFLVNVSLNIDGIAIVRWCLEHGVMYLDTSIERWPDEPDEIIPDLAERTLYSAHQEIRAACAEFMGQGPTCIVTNGANPGLVTYLTKEALLNIAKEMNLPHEVPSDREGWAQLAKATGTKVIQIAERDTQVMKYPKRVNEFVNTWSCEGFWAEGRAPAEMGWGTHENPKPEGGNVHREGPRNAAYLAQPGVSVLVKSWVPKGGQFNGFLIQHSEAITMSEYFTTADGSYRPTIYYAYQPCDAAILSVHEMRGAELRFHRRTRIAKNSIVAGRDELGVLLLGHGLNAYWYGSQLTIDEARALIPGENATSIQVGASILGAMTWAFENPDKGYLEPESLPHDFVLKIAKPYLGTVAGVQSDWTPLKNRNSLYKQDFDETNVWSFENFRV